MRIKVIFIKSIFIIYLILFGINQKSIAAEKIILQKGIFTRTITVKELEEFSKKQIKKGFLKKIIKKEDEEKRILKLLNKDYQADIVITSRLLNSKIGLIIIKRISKILYPFKYPDTEMGIFAIKSGTIAALAEGNNKINLISFFKAYPHKEIAINITEASKIINKVKSTAELVKFFTDSPLEKLKE